MNAYQRGNRDGLLNFAHELLARADEYQARADRQAHPRANPATVARSREADLWRATLLRDAAERAIRRSEAMPLDPEADVEDET